MQKRNNNKKKYLKKVKLILEDGEYPNLLDNKPLEYPEEVGKTFLAMKSEAVETCVCVCLDEKLIIKFFDVVALGDTAEVEINTKRLFKPILMSDAHSFIVVHNHPSGSCKPSKSDDILIKELQDISCRLNLKFLDFIIIGDEKFDKKKKNFWSLFSEARGNIKYHPLLDYKKI